MKRLFSIAPEWIVLFAGIIAAFHVGKLAPAIPVLQSEMGISLVEAGLLLSLVQLVGMSSGVFWGFSIGRFGLRRAVLTGSAIAGFFTSSTLMLISRAVEGMGFVLVVLSGPGLMRSLVTAEHLNIRMGWWGAFMGLGAGGSMVLGPILLEYRHWSYWCWISALMTFLTFWWVKEVIPSSVDADAKANVDTGLLAHLFDLQ